MLRLRTITLCSLLAASCTCDGPDINLKQYACATDSDCTDEYACFRRVCVLASSIDAGTIDAGFDAGIADAGPSDDAGFDAGTPDAGTPDAGAPDAGIDSGTPDAGVDAGDPCGTIQPPADAGEVAVYCAIHKTIVVDGDLSDWVGVPFTSVTRSNAGLAPGTWANDASTDDPDLSGSFALRWDAQYLYVAGSIVDDIRAIHPAAMAYYREDAFQLYWDGNHDRAVGYGPADRQFGIRADGMGEEFTMNGAGEVLSLPPEMLHAVKDGTTGANWTIEIAVPWALFGGPVPVSGLAIGFDIIIDDDDNPTTQTRKHYLIWTEHPQPGCNEPYCNSASNGTAFLTGAAP